MAEIVNVAVSPSHALSSSLPFGGILNVSLNMVDCFRTPRGVVVPVSSYQLLHTSIYFPNHLFQNPHFCRLYLRHFFLSEPFSRFGLPHTVPDCLASCVLNAANSLHTPSPFYLNAELELVAVVADNDDHYYGDHRNSSQFIDGQFIIDQTSRRSSSLSSSSSSSSSSRSRSRSPSPSPDRLNMTTHERVVAADHQDNDGDGCCICLEEFSAGTEFLRFGCKHVYHQNCIGKWLEKQNSCPLCRRPL